MTETIDTPTGPGAGHGPNGGPAGAPGRALRLRAATETTHGKLDQRIMAATPFASRASYGTFLSVQHAFHHDIAPLYDSPALNALLPDLARRKRLALVAQDLADLGLGAPAVTASPFTGAIDVPTALGWLYVAEGSNLGAAFLLKESAKLDLGEAFGARHLAPAPEGRGLAWRNFTAVLDAATLSPGEEAAVEAGAIAAFMRVRGLVDTLMPLDTVPAPDVKADV